MIMETKVKLPSDSHGLHKHRYNFPFLASTQFMECFPCYIKPLEAGESDHLNGGVFSRLNPITNAAFVTGRYVFKEFFVPSKFLFKPYNDVREQTEYKTGALISRLPYTTMKDLTAAFIDENPTLYNALVTGASVSSYDIRVVRAAGDSGNEYYKLTNSGCRILKILMCLGITPSWIMTDTTPVLVMPILAYLKAFADHIFPKQYVSSLDYRNLVVYLDGEDPDYTGKVPALYRSLWIASTCFYENSMFDFAWDDPAAPNSSQMNPSVSFQDITNNSSGFVQVVTNDSSAVATPSGSNHKPNNGTVFVGGNGTGSVTGTNASGVLTQYVIDTLRSISMWMKKRQIAGARLIDRYLVSRGIPISKDSARVSYYLGKKSVEIDVQAVENNSDTNLGELAGKAIASSGDKPLSFSVQNVDDDGYHMVLCMPVPDASFPIFTDPYNLRTYWDEFYNAKFDKLGTEAIPSISVAQSFSGPINAYSVGKGFGFLNRYYADIQDRPRLVGDFVVNSRGASTLQSFHSFRLFPDNLISTSRGMFHSYDFVRALDKSQYQRFFYSDKVDNLFVFIRWFGDSYQHKLPLGDSYDWDDDELNKKISLDLKQD